MTNETANTEASTDGAVAVQPVVMREGAEQTHVFATMVEKCPTCNSDVIDRTQGEDGFYEPVCPDGDKANRNLHAVKKAIQKYYLALDNRENGVQARIKAWGEIESAMGLTWSEGEMKSLLDKNPRLKRLYA